MNNSVKTYTLEEAKRALEHYCIYQDRCHKEIEEKLSKMRLIPEVIEIVITHLIAENFLNETRFSQSYARGKFRIKKWGKQRITQELKFRNISSYNIKKGLAEINEEEYFETFTKVALKKIETTKEPNPFKKRKKVYEYLRRLGYESNLINEVISSNFY
ncbi:regulatory protein RecX [Bacteroidota bacterium]